MPHGTEGLGFAGTALVIVGYVPQIWHLFREKCAAGINLKAYALWLLSSLLILVHALGMGSTVFIVLQGYQFLACGVIFLCARRFQDSVCELWHRDPQQHAATYTVL